jgi:hypothetical protein
MPASCHEEKIQKMILLLASLLLASNENFEKFDAFLDARCEAGDEDISV